MNSDVDWYLSFSEWHPEISTEPPAVSSPPLIDTVLREVGHIIGINTVLTQFGCNTVNTHAEFSRRLIHIDFHGTRRNFAQLVAMEDCRCQAMFAEGRGRLFLNAPDGQLLPMELDGVHVQRSVGWSVMTAGETVDSSGFTVITTDYSTRLLGRVDPTTLLMANAAGWGRAPSLGAYVDSASSIEEIVGAYDYRPVYHGKILGLYQAVFGRSPDLSGAKYWIDVFDRGALTDASGVPLTRDYDRWRRVIDFIGSTGRYRARHRLGRQ